MFDERIARSIWKYFGITWIFAVSEIVQKFGNKKENRKIRMASRKSNGNVFLRQVLTVAVVSSKSTTGNCVQQSETTLFEPTRRAVTNEQSLLSLRYNNEYDNYGY